MKKSKRSVIKNKIIKNEELVNLKGGGDECPNCEVWFEDHPDGHHVSYGYRTYQECGVIKNQTGGLFYTCEGYIG